MLISRLRYIPIVLAALLPAAGGHAALVAEYRFDAAVWNGTAGEVVDSSGNNLHGVAAAGTTQAGYLCGAADLSAAGESDYVALHEGALDGLTDFTVMVWYQSSRTNREMILSAANSGEDRELQLNKPNSSQLLPRVRNDADGRIDVSPISDGVWHHLAWTRNGGTNCFYVDGSLEECNNLNQGALDVDATGFVAGQELNGLNFSFRNNRGLRGLLDELYIFDNALPQPQIQTIRNNLTNGLNWDGSSRNCGSSAALVAEYRFDAESWQGSAEEVRDSSGNAFHGVARGADTGTGFLCRAADLRAAGSADYLDLNPAALQGLTDFTLIMWFQSTRSGRETLVSAANSVTSGELQWYKAGNTQLQPRLLGGSGGTQNIPDINDGNWHQLAWTRAGGVNCYYVDTALSGCLTLPQGSLDVAATGLVIGQEIAGLNHIFTSGRGVQGLVDEFYVFDGALTQGEISSINSNVLSGLNWDGSARLCNVNANLVADYHFDEAAWTGAADEVQDSGGNGYHGAANGAVTGADGVLCRAGDFSAAGTDHVSLDSAALQGLGDFTLAVWGRTGNTNAWQTLISGANAAVTNELVMLMNADTDFYPGISITFFNDAAEISGPAFNDNAWHHFVWTRDTANNESCFYFDGTLAGCSTHPAANDADPLDIDAGGFVVGQDQDAVGGGFETNQAWNGLLDELLIFDSNLSAAEIQSIYNNQLAGDNWDGSPRLCNVRARAEWRFDEQSWNGTAGEVQDSSGNGYSGTAQAVQPVSGLICNAADFSAAGTADYISLDHLALQGLSDFTLSLWVNSSNSGNKALLSGARNGQANAIIYWYNNAATFTGYVNNNAAAVTGPNVFDGNWHHLVWVRQGLSNCLYTDGTLRGCANSVSAALDLDAGGLVLGQEQDLVGGGFVASQAMLGLMDELVVFDFALAAAEIDNIYTHQLAGRNWDGTTRTCPLAAAAGFRVSHDGAGIHCAAEPVQVTAVDALGNVLSSYNQAIVLDTNNSAGNWRLLSGNGVLVDATADDGLAVYQFSALDGGSAVFALDYPAGPALVDVDVYQASAPGITDNDTEGMLAFAPSGFTVTASALANPPPAVINDPLPNQVAGNTFNLHLTAYGTTPSDAVCGVIETYQGAQTLHAWQVWLNPAGGSRQAALDGVTVGASEAAAVPLSVNFVSGQAVIPAQYKDAGQLRLQVKDQTSASATLYGGTNPFVSRPAALRISSVETQTGGANPAAAGNSGPGFVSAGTAFVVEVEVLDAEGDLTPNFGRENVPEGVSVSSNQLLLPLAGINGSAGDGSLGGADQFNLIAPGRLRNSAVVFDETGSIELRAAITDGDYLSAGAVAAPLHGPVGRFYVDHFVMDSGAVQASCNGFTYMAEPRLGIEYELHARNAAGARLFNYDQDLLGIANVAGVRTVAEQADNGFDLGARVAHSLESWQNGRYLLQRPGAQFLRLAAADGPYDQLAVGVQVTDTPDSRPFNGADMNAASPGDCTVGNTCNARHLGDTAVYYGRFVVLPAVGPEQLNLPVTAEVQTYTAGGFVEHSLDNCTTYQASDLALSGHAGNLQPAETSVIGPAAASTLVAGRTSLTLPPLLSAPGTGNDGSVQVLFNVAAWLRYAWQGGAQQNPANQAVFGAYRGHDRIIYWAEDP